MGIIVNEIEITDTIFDPDLDLYVVFGCAISATDKPFVTGWLARDKSTFIDTAHHSNELSAKAHFTDAVNGEIAPENFDYNKDPQCLSTYKWEDQHIFPYAVDLTNREIKQLILRVSKDAGIKAPKFFKLGDSETSYYDADAHAVHIGESNNIVVLHEMAHAIHAERNKENGKEFVNHAPQFVWILMDLYRQYGGFSAQYLMISAHQAGILGDLDSPQPLTRFS